MAFPKREIKDASFGQITSTSRRVLNKVGIKVLKTRGVRARGRRRR